MDGWLGFTMAQQIRVMFSDAHASKQIRVTFGHDHVPFA